MSSSSCRRLGQTALLLVLCLAVSACANKKINKTNFEKIETGMTLKEVRDIFGEPGKKDEGGDASGVAAQFMVDIPGAAGAARKPPGDVYLWERGEITITIYFDINGKVANKQAKGL
jgi:hypothetical protein